MMECLHDLELKIGDLQKMFHPLFESVLRNNVDTVRSNDEIGNYKSGDRILTLPVTPYRQLPKIIGCPLFLLPAASKVLNR
jgi:hypothetical protein